MIGTEIHLSSLKLAGYWRTFLGERGRLGTLDLMVNLQRLDVGASFSDWGVLAYDSYQQNGDFVENSGNRVVLLMTSYALKWSQGFWDDSLVATAGLRFAQGGPQGAESLRETLGEVERQRSGFEGTDAFVELFRSAARGYWRGVVAFGMELFWIPGRSW